MRNFSSKKYYDYRDLIADLVSNKRENSKHFSFQSFSLHTGTSRGYLKLLIDKKRHTRIEQLIPISHFFDLTKNELNFLVFLFLATTSNEADLKNLFYSYSQFELSQIPI